MPKDQLSREPWPGTCGCHSLSSLLFGCYSSPQTFTLTAASYWICLHFPMAATGINKEGLSLWCG